MMLILLMGVLAGGCVAGRGEVVERAVDHEAVPAAALVFDTPAGQNVPPELLARAGRGETAYWGLQGPTTTYHYIRTDDRWGFDDFRGNFGDSYRRRAVMMQLGVSVRP